MKNKTQKDLQAIKKSFEYAHLDIKSIEFHLIQQKFPQP